jgi:hypothetical protein
VVRQENGANREDDKTFWSIARSATELIPGQELLIQLNRGQIKAQVIDILTD